eukprot:scaffold64421_cov31-Tisochrysis_lutea.AAC.4
MPIAGACLARATWRRCARRAFRRARACTCSAPANRATPPTPVSARGRREPAALDRFPSHPSLLRPHPRLSLPLPASPPSSPSPSLSLARSLPLPLAAPSTALAHSPPSCRTPSTSSTSPSADRPSCELYSSSSEPKAAADGASDPIEAWRRGPTPKIQKHYRGVLGSLIGV